jgi:hypothetical protein
LGAPLCGACCPYAESEPDITIKAKRPAPSICGAESQLALSHLAVLIDFDDILFTSAPGIRKRFQSSPNALEICNLITPKPGRGFPFQRRKTAPDFQAIKVNSAER